MEDKKSLFKTGLKDGFPIGLGYFPLAVTLGISSSAMGLNLFYTLLMSALGFTGIGQMTTMNLMQSNEQYIGLFLSLLIINLRNIVLSLTMSQKIDPNTKLGKMLIISMGNTDEIFALTIRKEGKIPSKYFLGVMTVPYVGWLLGELLGVVAGNLLPQPIVIAMNMGLYAMLISAVVPAAKESKPILYVATLSSVISCIMQWLKEIVPEGNIFSGLLQSGGIIILGSVFSATLIAWKFPINTEEEKVNE